MKLFFCKLLPVILLASLLLGAGIASAQGDHIKIVDSKLRWEWSLIDAKLMISRFDQKLGFDFGHSEDFYLNGQIGLFQLGFYYGRFGFYCSPIRFQKLWDHDGYPGKYVLVEPIPIGMSFIPFYWASYSRDAKQRSVNYNASVSGNVKWQLRLFGEISFLGKVEHSSSKEYKELPKINETYPSIITAGAQLGFKMIALEAGYIYQSKIWHEFYKEGLVDDSVGLDMTGPYLALRINIGAIRTKGWSQKFSEKPPLLKAGFIIGSENSARDIYAGQEKIVIVKVENKGEGTAHGVQVKLESSNSDITVYPPERFIDKINPEGEETVNFTLAGDESLMDANVAITAQVRSDDGQSARKNEDFIAYAFKPPRLEVVETIINDEKGEKSWGNANGLIDPGETILAKTIIKNAGDGPAEFAKANITYNGNSLQSIGPQSKQFYHFPPHSLDSIIYSFFVKTDASSPNSDAIQLEIKESNRKYGGEFSILNTISEPDPVDHDIPVGKTRRPNALAIVIGVSQYSSPDLPTVLYAEHDAATVCEYLEKAFGYKKSNIIKLLNPTKAQLEDYFGTPRNPGGKVRERVREGIDELFVYYSGHGAPQPRSDTSYLILSDCMDQNYQKYGYSRDALLANLSQLNLKQVTVVLDACFSGFYNDGPLTPGASAIYKDTFRGNLKNGVIFTAAQEDQRANWYMNKRHGLFTYLFLKGLSGDADKENRDGKITIDEMTKYLQSRSNGVPFYSDLLWHRPQMPAVKMGGENTNQVMVELQ